ncbi:MAG TPA: hypothetical protein PLO13_00400 [Anaerolineaceae bacterium]|nr:hypothetical protein [Anaerolineaceae bacterium]HQJ31794.1 hypothetical protein [Anaerolineaceae bacterium]
MPDDNSLNMLVNRLRILVIFVAIALLVVGSSVTSDNPLDGLRKYTRGVEFDFVEWEISALFNKAVSASLKLERFLDNKQQVGVIQTWLAGTENVINLEQDLLTAQNDSSPNRDELVQAAKTNLDQKKADQNRLAKLAEAVLQNQTEITLAKAGFGLGGQILPPVLYQVSDLPLNLIISPRTEIRNVLSLSLDPGLDAIEKDEIETGIYKDFDLSALIEPVGGIGAYPTMVMRTTDLNWLAETIAHEWIHNYLAFFPLGMRYYVNDQMRTINETTASLAGKEIGLDLIISFYPDRTPRYYLQMPTYTTVLAEGAETLNPFDFRAEMHETRVKVDALLAEGKVEEAEQYMEARRRFFWENGYRLRKINQAYFAFYGSYNDTPGGGASGADPVGPAVQALRTRYSSLKEFLQAIRFVSSFDQLLQLLD